MRRIVLAAAALATIVAGLGAHAAGWGAVSDALYAVLIYLLLALVMRRLAWVPALAWCVGVELFQLTGWPAAWGSPWALIFGSGFAWGDLLAYGIGVGLAAGIDAAVAARLRRKVADPSRRREA